MKSVWSHYKCSSSRVVGPVLLCSHVFFVKKQTWWWWWWRCWCWWWCSTVCSCRWRMSWVAHGWFTSHHVSRESRFTRGVYNLSTRLSHAHQWLPTRPASDSAVDRSLSWQRMEHQAAPVLRFVSLYTTLESVWNVIDKTNTANDRVSSCFYIHFRP